MAKIATLILSLSFINTFGQGHVTVEENFINRFRWGTGSSTIQKKLIKLLGNSYSECIESVDLDCVYDYNGKYNQSPNDFIVTESYYNTINNLQETISTIRKEYEEYGLRFFHRWKKVENDSYYDLVLACYDESHWNLWLRLTSYYN